MVNDQVWKAFMNLYGSDYQIHVNNKNLCTFGNIIIWTLGIEKCGEMRSPSTIFVKASDIKKSTILEIPNETSLIHKFNKVDPN